jgi:hypothetical protein
MTRLVIAAALTLACSHAFAENANIAFAACRLQAAEYIHHEIYDNHYRDQQVVDALLHDFLAVCMHKHGIDWEK